MQRIIAQRHLLGRWFSIETIEQIQSQVIKPLYDKIIALERRLAEQGKKDQ